MQKICQKSRKLQIRPILFELFRKLPWFLTILLISFVNFSQFRQIFTPFSIFLINFLHFFLVFLSIKKKIHGFWLVFLIFDQFSAFLILFSHFFPNFRTIFTFFLWFLINFKLCWTIFDQISLMSVKFLTNFFMILKNLLVIFIQFSVFFIIFFNDFYQFLLISVNFLPNFKRFLAINCLVITNQYSSNSHQLHDFWSISCAFYPGLWIFHSIFTDFRRFFSYASQFLMILLQFSFSYVIFLPNFQQLLMTVLESFLLFLPTFFNVSPNCR